MVAWKPGTGTIVAWKPGTENDGCLVTFPQVVLCFKNTDSETTWRQTPQT